MRLSKRYVVALTVCVVLLMSALVAAFNPGLRASFWLRMYDCGIISDDTVFDRLVGIGRPAEGALLNWLRRAEDPYLGAEVFRYIPDPQRWLDAAVIATSRFPGTDGYRADCVLQLVGRNVKRRDIPRLVVLLDHPHDGVKMLAIDALRDVGSLPNESRQRWARPVPDEEVQRALRKVAESAAYDDRVKESARSALVELSYGGREGMQTVRDMLHRGTRGERLQALSIIDRYGGDERDWDLVAWLHFRPAIMDEEMEREIVRILKVKYAHVPRVKEALEEAKKRKR